MVIVSPENILDPLTKRSTRLKQLASNFSYADPPDVNQKPQSKRKSVSTPKSVSNKKPKVAEDESSSVGVRIELSDEEMMRKYGDDGVGSGNARALVKETLRTFNKHYLHFVQEEEKRCGVQKADKKKNAQKSRKEKEKVLTDDEVEEEEEDEDEESPKGKGKRKGKAKRSHDKRQRPDLKTITKMRQEKSAIYTEKRIGHIPGVDVGHQFFSRSEMVVLGFHHHWLKGIDYIGDIENASKDLVLKNFKGPLTASIVMSGQYEDDLDNCDEIVYTGQGGNNLLGNRRQIKDQVMRQGNLGLKNCKDLSVPVRVVRGRKCKDSYVGKVYSYDGLYKVVGHWAEEGVSGFTVYKYKLKRLEGQVPLTTAAQVQFEGGRAPKSASEIRGLVCKDISGGLEVIPIPVTNLVENPPVSVEGFTYITEMKLSHNVKGPSVASMGCNCQGVCTDPSRCSCAKLNGGDFPYVQKNGGRLVEPKSVVFECGPHCGCGPNCVNRTSQNGPKYRLEVFRTPMKGWGVRSWDYIPSGAPVCEYIGLLKGTDDIDPTADNSYVFDIDLMQTMKGLDGRESRLRDVSLPSYLQNVIDKEVSETVPFCIDAAKKGNITRFINHCCSPNLFVQCILSSHHDMTLARVVLVAADNIPPLKELNYDYGYALDSVVGPDGEIRQMPCYCGAEGCRGRLF